MSMPGWQASQARRSQNCEVIGPLTGQIIEPLPFLIAPAGRLPAACCSVALIFACWALRSERLPSSCLRSVCTWLSALRLSARVPARPTRVLMSPCLTWAISSRRCWTIWVTFCWRDSSLASFLDSDVASDFAERTSLMICWSCSEMRCMNSPRSSSCEKPLEDMITVTRSGASAW